MLDKGDCILQVSHWVSVFSRKAKTAWFVTQYFAKKFLVVLNSRLPGITKHYANNFPAVHLRMDRWFYFSNFSSELVVIALVLFVSIFSIWNFQISSASTDQSLAMKLLSYHSDLNPKLYAQSNTIKTVVVGNNRFVSEAYAEESLTPQISEETTVNLVEEEEDVIVDNAITNPNGSDAQKLLHKQIQIYTTQPGDTLAKIAKQFGLSMNTIMWANGLSGSTIKPGWYLKILPSNGILIQAGPNTSLAEVAKKYNGDLATLIAYNGLEDEEDLRQGDLIMCVSCSMPAPPTSAKPAAKKTITPSIPTNLAKASGNNFAKGQCTDYVARVFSTMGKEIPWRGNAGKWDKTAPKFGALVNHVASVGAIIQTTDSPYGHVAVVESVSGSTVTFSEWNYAGKYKKTVRTLSLSDKSIRNYIHY
jgi:surface antigen/LysM repeat protein